MTDQDWKKIARASKGGKLVDEVKGCENKNPLCLLAAKPHVLFSFFMICFSCPHTLSFVLHLLPT